MNTTIELPIDLKLSGDSPLGSRHPCVGVRFLAEDEIVELLQDRLGKSEAEVRQVLESYQRVASAS